MTDRHPFLIAAWLFAVSAYLQLLAAIWLPHGWQWFETAGVCTAATIVCIAIDNIWWP